MELGITKPRVPAKLHETHPRRKALAARASQDALRRLSDQLIRTQDQERRRLARELHDSVGQYLVALKIDLELLHISQPLFPEKKAEHLLLEALLLTDQCLSETRSISHLLHPPVLDEVGLPLALRKYIDGYVERTGIHTQLDISTGCDRLSPDVQTAVYRMVQEGLSNIHRHSGSPTAEIRLEREGAFVILEISDHGCGISSDKLPLCNNRRAVVGVGLAGMRERVRQLGGHFQLHSSHQGTKLKAKLPAEGRA
jgi:signal transduction histidine kinase